MLKFDGRVVLVTGAGGGLGREYALMFGERGASVVVNDLGGSAMGEGNSTRMADLVVNEILSKGGKAVANYDSVEHGDKLIKTAIDNFGRIDVVVNNAGILRDKSIKNMTDNDWDLIQKVHLRGAFTVSRAAWPYMRQQKYGRIIVTSSNSGVYGSFGQANYSAAKLGLVGLSNTLSMEGAKYNIYSNALVPTAGSRLTQTVMPQEMIEALDPKYVAPMVVWLSHETCTDTGGVFEAAAGWFGRLKWARSRGKFLATAERNATPEEVRDNWQVITSMDDCSMLNSSQEASAIFMEHLTSGSKTSSPSQQLSEPVMDPNLCRGYQLPQTEWEYTFRDSILYALGVGASMRNANDLRFLYENHENCSVLPSFAVLPVFRAMGTLGDVPGIKYDLSKVLHGEQYIEVRKPLATSGKLTTKAKVTDLLDKGKGALIIVDTESYDEAGDLVALNQFSTFIVGEGGFGGPGRSASEISCKEVPKRSPDASITEATAFDQAALYRLSGDYNPLHIDSSFAALLGFKQPILHGLCTLGFSVRHVLQQYANNDVSLFKAVKVRFQKPVIPGQTLTTEMWREGNTIHFQTRVAETGQVCTSGGYVELRAVESPGPKTGGGGAALQSAKVFDQMRKRLESQPGLAKKVNAMFLWVITKNGKEAGKFTVDMKTGDGEIYEGDPRQGKPGVTLTLSDDDMVKLVEGKLNPQQAFMSGKLKLKGNIMLTQKLQNLLKDQSKL